MSKNKRLTVSHKADVDTSDRIDDFDPDTFKITTSHQVKLLEQAFSSSVEPKDYQREIEVK